MNEPEPVLDAAAADVIPPAPPARGAVLLRWIRSALRVLTILYFIVLVLLLGALEWWGERNWILSIFLYAPPALLLLPLLALTPLCLLFRWRLLGWHLAAGALVFFGYMNFRWSAHAPAAAGVSAVTFNAGDSDRAEFQAFLAEEKPDLIFLQDRYGRGSSRPLEVPDTFTAAVGQFALISRFPIEKFDVIESVQWSGEPVAMRFEVILAGQRTALYNVRLPTPRRELARFLGGRRVLGGIVRQVEGEPYFAQYQEWLAARIELARGLARVLAAEPLPMIVAGDFNTPDHGYIYRLFAGEMTDAFARSGRGWGLTFPGTTRAPFEFLSPWLRIDYFFVGRGWEPIECRPQHGQKSQHKAVLARFKPRPIP